MRRIPELDGLRGLALLIILGSHVSAWFAPSSPAAIEMFLVSSGFLLTFILLGSGGQVDVVRTYALRRVSSLMPLALVVLPVILAGGLGPIRGDLAILGLVAQFTVIAPVIVLPARGAWLPFAALAAVIGSPLARAHGVSDWLLIARADGFALGAFLAWSFIGITWTEHNRRWARCILLPIAAGMLFFLEHHRNASVVTPLVLDLVVVALLGLTVSHAGTDIFPWLRSGPFALVGRAPHAVFIAHLVVTGSVAACGESPALAAILIGLLTLPAAGLAWWLVERPLQALRRRFAYSVPTRNEGGRSDLGHVEQTGAIFRRWRMARPGSLSR